jgi:hypothetical protein
MMEKTNHTTAAAGTSEVEHVDATQQVSGAERKDKAFQLLKEASTIVVVDDESNRRVLRKIDRLILPLMLGCYFVQSVDKASLSYASVFDLISATHLVVSQLFPH